MAKTIFDDIPAWQAFAAHIAAQRDQLLARLARDPLASDAHVTLGKITALHDVLGLPEKLFTESQERE